MGESNEKSERSRDKLSSDLREVRKKVRTLEDDLKSSQTESARYLSVLTEVHVKVKPIVSPPVKTEDTGTETIPQVNGTVEESDEAKTLVKEKTELEKVEMNS